MHLHVLADKLRASLPRPCWDIVRKIGNAILGPMHFSLETGHFRSCLRSRAIDRGGQPLPWYTYPAIQYLLGKNFDQKRVLEWGGGQSTLFWAKRAKHVVVLEGDPEWHNILTRYHLVNASIHLIQNDVGEAEPFLNKQCFDVIVIDGLDRWKCAQRSLRLLAEEGVIIVDDAERNCGRRAGYGCIDFYRESGLSRIDFYGYSPGNSTQHCTSMFFREACFLNRGEENPAVTISFWRIA